MKLTRLSRLLVALPSTRMGGTERHAAELAARLAARSRMKVTLAAEPALLPALRKLAGPGVVHLPARIGRDEDESPEVTEARQIREGERLLEAANPDLLLLPLPWPDAGLGLMRLAADRGLPRILHLHLAADGPVPEAVEAARPALGLEGALLAAVSAPVARRAAHLFGRPAHEVLVVPNPAPAPAGMDRPVARAALRSALGLAPEAPLLLYMGRLEEAKGADLLPAISDRLPVTLAVAGDGPLRGLLDARAAEDPRGLLRTMGPVADPAPWYLAADGLVLPSRLEGAPLVFLEAAANGCPVIATAAALEALGEDAPRLARIAATPDAAGIAAAAEGLLADPAGAATMAEAARAHAARLGWPRLVEHWLGLLRLAALRATPAEGRVA
jgi:glycosyltransferase involved in cell wall biosynthesis